MKTRRLTIHYHKTLVGKLDCHGVNAEYLINQVESVLKSEEGWTLSRWVSDQEKRLLESTPQGMKVLSIEKIFHPE